MVLDTSLLNTQHYKVRIKGKIEQLGVVTTEKGAFELPLTTVANFTILNWTSKPVKLLAIFKKFSKLVLKIFKSGGLFLLNQAQEVVKYQLLIMIL